MTTCLVEHLLRALTWSQQRRINGSTKPVNTLSARRFETHNEPDVPPTKRQKKDVSETYGETSKYFPAPRPSKSSEVPEVVVESSQDDIYDIRSTSSAGTTSKPTVAVSEYRHVFPQSRKGTRVRKSRASSNSGSQPRRDTVETRPNLHRRPGLQSSRGSLISIASIGPDSPDVLASEDPSSTNIDAFAGVSPYFSTKRERPLHPADTFGPHIKRHKPSTVKETIDISEDELQADCAKFPEPKSGKSPSSRFSDICGGHAKAPMRGDIHPTVFGKPPHRPRSDDIAITRAVCGKYIYSRDDHTKQVSLCREGKESTRLVPVSEDDQLVKEYAWLGIDLDQVLSFGYSEAPGRHGYIMRSQSAEAGAKLYLEFANVDSNKHFCEILKSANVEGAVMYVLCLPTSRLAGQKRLTRFSQRRIGEEDGKGIQ